MKRRQLIKHLKAHGCEFSREGANHTIYHNPATGNSAPVPRHSEVSNMTARAVCDQLGIPRV